MLEVNGCDNLLLSELADFARHLKGMQESAQGCLNSISRIDALSRSGQLDSVIRGESIGRGEHELFSTLVSLLDRRRSAPPAVPADMRRGFDIIHRGLRFDGRLVRLGSVQEDVLRILWRNAPEPVSRETMVEEIYQGQNRPKARTIDVIVHHLRRKLKEAGGEENWIQAWRGRGWFMREDLVLNSD